MNTNPQIDHLGNKYWRNEKGQYHREDGPAVEYADGTKVWYINHQPHRLDGPAVEYANGDKNWYLEGQYYTESSFKAEIEKRNQAKMKVETKAPEKPGKYRNEKLEPYVEGEPYFEISFSGSKFWCNEKGQLHRLDGPAMEYANGYKSWRIEGEYYSEAEFNAEIKKRNEAKMKTEKPKPGKYRNEKLEPYVKGKPYFEIGFSGSKYWRNEQGQLHREDGPAIEYAHGDKQWYINGKFHREDGPAIEHIDGYKEWWIENKFYSESDFKIEIEKRNQAKMKAETKDSDKPKPGTYRNEKLESYVKGEPCFQIDYYGNKFWYNENDLLHREDGPAVEYANGYKEWHIEGKYYSEAEFKVKIGEKKVIDVKLANVIMDEKHHCDADEFVKCDKLLRECDQMEFGTPPDDNEVGEEVSKVNSRRMNMFKMIARVAAVFSFLVAIGSVVEFGSKWAEEVKSVFDSAKDAVQETTSVNATVPAVETPSVDGLDSEIKLQEEVIAALSEKVSMLDKMPKGDDEFASLIASRTKMLKVELASRIAYEQMILRELKRSRDMIVASRMIRSIEQSVR